MARKIIIDCDMGTDDTVALCMLLFDERLEVLGVTATAGCVDSEQANRNLQAILTLLDPDRYPRIGLATPVENGPAVDTQFLYGQDGLGNVDFEATVRQNAPTAEKLIIDTVRRYPDEVTLVCLGPPTNVARAIRREPQITPLIDRIVMMGGSLTASGNITPAAEFNFYFDPQSAREVLAARTTNLLVPLDITQEVKFGMDILRDIPGEESRVGDLLRQILPFTFRAHRQQLGMEQISLNDAVAALAIIEPELFEFKRMAADVEIEGSLTRGVLVLDRRERPESRQNVDVAVSVRDSASQYVIDQLTMAGHKSK